VPPQIRTGRAYGLFICRVREDRPWSTLVVVVATGTLVLLRLVNARYLVGFNVLVHRAGNGTHTASILRRSRALPLDDALAWRGR
jgi:hypothetical protein